MADLVVRPVDTRSEQKRFIRLPWRIYRDDPCWMPPLIMSQQELLGFRRHPFYERARSRSFLATRGGVDVGRVTAIVNPGHNDRHHERRGFFGFFECDDDRPAARALFGAARDWLHAQGMTAVRGPVNPSLNYECGLLIEGFDTPPFFMMTHNRPWYGRLVEENGFGKVEDMYAFWGEMSMLETIDPKLYSMTESIRKWDCRFIRLAREVASWSRDPSTKVGAVAVDAKRRVLSLGYNGFARGVCDDNHLYEIRELKYPRIIHAEANAILNATASLEGSTVYVWPLCPCSTCAGMLIQAGVKRVVTVPNDNPRWKDSFVVTEEMFSQSGVSLDYLPRDIVSEDQLSLPW